MIRLLMHVAGLDNGSGPWYLFWSGIGGRFTVAATMLAIWHRHVCHMRGCLRPGRHKQPDSPHVFCFKHSQWNQPRKSDFVQEGEV